MSLPGGGAYAAGQDRSLAAEQRRRIAELERALGKKTRQSRDVAPHKAPVWAGLGVLRTAFA